MGKSNDTPSGAGATAKDEDSTVSLPPIAAAFLVKFDNRKGYTLAWHRQTDDLDIEGVVEFKSLPSGLHKVKEDLIYFTHDQHAGISAFLNRQDDEDDRNARMLAVGVMVPIESGRMGKSWLHAESLKELAIKQIDHQEDYSALEKYWEEHKVHTGSQQEDRTSRTNSKSRADPSVDSTSRPVGYKSSISMSPGPIQPSPAHTLSVHHPALALTDLLSTFGPLIFPLLRASLLRKRILLLGEAPVERSCNFVYNLSILSSLPRDAASFLPLDDSADLHLQPLFNVGVSDISTLEKDESGQGWIACTTDDVLCTKPDLFDVLVILPSSLHGSSKRFPKMIISSPELSKAHPKDGLKASQRDARRFVTLSKGLRVIPPSTTAADESAVVDDENDEIDKNDNIEVASTTSAAASTYSRTSIVESPSWSRIAYTSLIWWASAGDNRAGLSETEENELDQDATLLDFQDPNDEMNGDQETNARTKEVAIVAYFHRLTELIFQILGEAVARTQNSSPNGMERYTDNDDEGEEEGNDEPNNDQQALLPDNSKQRQKQKQNTNNDNGDDTNEKDSAVEVSQDDVANMGLDLWSTSDQKFIEEMVSFWWGREATVQGGRIECCGIRLI